MGHPRADIYSPMKDGIEVGRPLISFRDISNVFMGDY